MIDFLYSLFIDNFVVCLAITLFHPQSFIRMLIVSAVAARNVMFTLDGVLVIIDFGLARLMHIGTDDQVYYKQFHEFDRPVRWYILCSYIC
jgi:hypothetical protein